MAEDTGAYISQLIHIQMLFLSTELVHLCCCFLQTEEEIAEMEEDIRRLNEAIRDKIKPSKLAQTRLENRTYRPGADLCRDNVQYGLTDEAKQLDVTKKSLQDKLRQAQWVKRLTC